MFFGVQMVFQNSVQMNLKAGPQNHHLVAYKHNGDIDSIAVKSDYVQESGSINLEKACHYVANEIGAKSEQVKILSVSALGCIEL